MIWGSTHRQRSPFHNVWVFRAGAYWPTATLIWANLSHRRYWCNLWNQSWNIDMEYFTAYRAFFSQQLWGYFTLYGNSSPKKSGSLCGNNMPNRQVSPPLIHGSAAILRREIPISCVGIYLRISFWKPEEPWRAHDSYVVEDQNFFRWLAQMTPLNNPICQELWLMLVLRFYVPLGDDNIFFLKHVEISWTFSNTIGFCRTPT